MIKRLSLWAAAGLSAALLWQCGNTPGLMPEIINGFIRIAAQNLENIDSVYVALDGDELGLLANPTVLEVVPGTHRLSVVAPDRGGELYPALEVAPEETTLVDPVLDAGPTTGPYIGQLAPAFAATTIDGQPVSDNMFASGVTLLIFMEYT